ncbi:Mitochondrial import inner membrane translocase subunit Tim54 [Phaffia rhodozyma]|uniref:Mitochondrial import inner membrane translocase subunit TIM54 n=1 Tax=Phaffia rhodozyma TaxID=264483 RepID=A0A0F7SV35_PHARH|nr:Mitochondrial import inner membrane translocase subunit Tim54 [Phaffia rhodozyma]
MATPTPTPPVVPKPPANQPLPAYIVPTLPSKLPHKGWFIAAAIVSIPTYFWYDDRQKAEAIKQEYLAKVKFLAEKPLEDGHLGGVRTCTVYASRWPGEEEGKAAAWWKRYVKPYLVAAAVDYTLPSLPEYTSLSEHLANKYRTIRSTSSSVPFQPRTPTQLSPEQLIQRELDGGVMIIGRHTLKEYLDGLKKGWFEDRPDESWIDKLDRSIYEDPALKDQEGSSSSLPEVPEASSKPPSSLFSPLGPPRSTSPIAVQTPTSAELPPLQPAPSMLPPLPPTILIPYHPELGFSSIPRSILSFFNTRADVKMGAEAAMAFILQEPSRDFQGPTNELVELGKEQGGDLDFDLEDGEWRVPGNFEKTPKQVEERMKTYYEGLPPKLKAVWELRKGTREPTDAEQRHPPFSLEEYLEGQIKRERRAKGDLAGYELLKKNSPLTWDDRFNAKWKVWDWDHKSNKGASVFS